MDYYYGRLSDTLYLSCSVDPQVYSGILNQYNKDLSGKEKFLSSSCGGGKRGRSAKRGERKDKKLVPRGE